MTQALAFNLERQSFSVINRSTRTGRIILKAKLTYLFSIRLYTAFPFLDKACYKSYSSILIEKNLS